MQSDTLEFRAALIREDMRLAADKWQHPVKLIAVTKTHPAEEINPLITLDMLNIGENRVQEIISKKPFLDEKFNIFLIGRLQSNKVKYIIDDVCQIQSVDRMNLAQVIDREAHRVGKQMSVLVQVSPAGEEQKGGVPYDEAHAFIQNASKLDGIRIGGLMAVMPLTTDEAYLRGLFTKMRTLYDQLREEAIANVQMDELSMGMSNDYRLALDCGATTIRVGTALFGTRR